MQKSTIEAFDKEGNIVNIPITIEKAATGDDVAHLQKQEFDKNNRRYTQISAPNLLLPSGAGYLENTWTKRDLNTITKQLNLDLTKYIEIGRTQHNLSYGGLWSEIKKEMINHSGFNTVYKTWWAIYPQDCQSGDGFNPFCNRIDTYSFLIPVKQTLQRYILLMMSKSITIGALIGHFVMTELNTLQSMFLVKPLKYLMD